MSGVRRRRALVFAHRGASGEFPEHTRAAYLHAVEQGADGLEIDVHLSADGQVICFHDFTLDRTTSGSGPLAELSLAQLRQLDVSSWKTPELPAEYGAADEQLMTLQDTLQLLGQAGRSMRLAIELKHPSPFGHQLEDRVLEVLAEAGWDVQTSQISFGEHQVEVSFMSFYAESLLHLAQTVPASKLCALYADIEESDVEEGMARRGEPAHLKAERMAHFRGLMRDSENLVWSRQAIMAGPGVAYAKAHPQKVRALVAQGTTMRIWTVNTTDEADMLLQLGVEELTTNYPGKILAHISTVGAPEADVGQVR